MIKFIIARHNDEIFKTYLEPSLNEISEKENVEVFQIFNVTEKNSMYMKYNLGSAQANPEDNDILVFIHEDVKILDPNFCKKLEMVFSKKPDVGVVGIVGTKVLSPFGWWSNEYKHHVGHWHQEYEDGSVKHMIRKIGFDSDMVAIDGCCFAVRGKVSKQVKFMEENFPKSFHFYDYSYCVSVLEAGWNVAVADISILHKSEGALPPDWHESRAIFTNIMTSKGYHFPLTKEQIKK